jgi:hypothetical protein
MLPSAPEIIINYSPLKIVSMKKLLFICLLLPFIKVNAQDPAYPPAPAAPLNVVKAEYFIDTDPGFGLGTDIPVTAALDIPSLAATINTAALTAGAHRLFVRSLNAEGEWSLTAIRQFVVDFDPAYPSNTAPLNVVKAEYFIDTDPGFGLGTDIPVTAALDIPSLAATINTAALTAGAHRLFVRSLNAEGEWSLTAIRQFVVEFDPAYPTSPAPVQNIIQAEYFVDTDPGFGNGITIPLSAATDIPALIAGINTNLLPAGAHRLYVRTRSNEGHWSVTSSSQFVVNDDPAYPPAPVAPGNITFAEYFFDTDPGFGNGTPITITPAVDINNLSVSVNTASLTAGPHFFFIRSLDDWGLTSVRELQVNSTLPVTFTHFSGKVQGNDILLNWATASEQNSSHYEVERSTEGRSFVKVGSVTAAGNSSSASTYHFTDAGLGEGIYHYRLKQVDVDGRFIYSAVLTLRITRPGEIVVFPNPVSNQLWLRGVTDNTPLHIYTLSGSLVRSAVWKSSPIEVDDLPAGVYQLQIITGDTIIMKKFIKQ